VNLFHWTDAAKDDLRGIDREQAMNILHHLTDYDTVTSNNSRARLTFGSESATIASASSG